MASSIRQCPVPSALQAIRSSRAPLCAACSLQLQRRQLSTTLQRSGISGRRRAMFRWLDGPGAAFKQPLPGSTNYLNAYDASGNLMRAPGFPVPGRQRPIGQPNDSEAEQTSEESSSDSQEEPGRRKKSEVLVRELEKAANAPVLPPREKLEDLIPFPMNRYFRSEQVLSEELKEEIYQRVMTRGRTVRDVSATLGVEMRRVGAVIRLKAMEKQWEEKGKVLATPYAKAVMSMLPQTPYIPNDPQPHESINDLPVHYATTHQIFHPVSESRHFTRRDAAEVFDRTLRPAEDRIPHPELYEMEKWKAEGMVPAERNARRKQANEDEIKQQDAKQKLREERERHTVKKVPTSRWEFRFQDISAEIGRNDERDRRSIGARYGMPHEDRKKGQVKIPKKVTL